MAMRRRTGLAVLGLVGLGVAGATLALWRPAGKAPAPAPATSTAAVADPGSPLADLAGSIGKGDAKALATLYGRVMNPPEAEGPPRGLSEAEAADWVTVLEGLRSGYPRFSAYGRSSALALTGRVLDKFAAESAPASWAKALPPAHDLLSAGLADAAPDTRLAAMVEVGRLWTWAPGRSLIPVETTLLGQWKQGFHAPVVRRLADPLPAQRAAAVACLANLPIDSAAAPAVAYLADPNLDVRLQVLSAFAGRRSLLDDEALLRQLSARDPRLTPVVEKVLKGRGLSPDQIGLGALIVHPKPELRASVIPMLAGQNDLDPVVWLVRLSRDKVESVRLKAAEALARHDSPEARARLDEMASDDPSVAVKATAKALVGQVLTPGEQTAALPPLPGSASLMPKAN